MSPNLWRLVSPDRHRPGRLQPPGSYRPPGLEWHCCHVRATARPLDPSGQDCASEPRFRRRAACGPRRLEPYRSPRPSPRTDHLHTGVAISVQVACHPFNRLAPRGPRQQPLGPDRPRLAEHSDRVAQVPVSQRCFQSAHASHVVKDEHPDFLWLSARTRLANEALLGSRLGPRFGETHHDRPPAVDRQPDVWAHTSDARVTSRRPLPRG